MCDQIRSLDRNIWSHGRRRDRQQRPAQAIADAVDLVRARDRYDRVERRHRPEAKIGVDIEVAVRALGIVPGQDEHGIALGHQPAD